MTPPLLLLEASQKLAGNNSAAPTAIGLPDAPGIPWVRIIVALFFCLAVSVAAIFALRHMQNRGSARTLFAGFKRLTPTSAIEIVETRRASAHAQVCLIHYQGQAFLIATTSTSVTVIDTHPRQAPEEGDAA